MLQKIPTSSVTFVWRVQNTHSKYHVKSVITMTNKKTNLCFKGINSPIFTNFDQFRKNKSTQKFIPLRIIAPKYLGPLTQTLHKDTKINIPNVIVSTISVFSTYGPFILTGIFSIDSNYRWLIKGRRCVRNYRTCFAVNVTSNVMSK